MCSEVIARLCLTDNEAGHPPVAVQGRFVIVKATTNQLLEKLPPVTIGLGTAALGRPAYITTSHGSDLSGRADKAAMEANAMEVFDFAYANGVRYFDAARSYGLAEHFLARWIARSNPLDIVVGSKWGYTYVADWQQDAEVQEVKDHSVEAFRRQLGETQALLGSHLALYQIHSVTPESPALQDAQLLSELADLRDTGVAIGVSTSGPKQGEVLNGVSDIVIDGEPLFSAVQTTWNLLETSTSEAIDRLAENGIAIIIKEALANGRLTSAGDLPPTAPGVEATPDAIALAAAGQYIPSNIILSGALTVEHLRSNLLAHDLQLPDRSEVMPAAVEPASYWNQRSTLAWT